MGFGQAKNQIKRDVGRRFKTKETVGVVAVALKQVVTDQKPRGLVPLCTCSEGLQEEGVTWEKASDWGDFSLGR